MTWREAVNEYMMPGGMLLIGLAAVIFGGGEPAGYRALGYVIGGVGAFWAGWKS